MVNIYYHGTIKGRITKILIDGIKPSAERRSLWYLDGNKIKAVGLTTNYKEACAYACRKAHMFHDKPIVLTLEIPAEEEKRLEILETHGEKSKPGGNQRVAIKTIPPEFIKEVKKIKLLKLKEVAEILGLEIEYDG